MLARLLIVTYFPLFFVSAGLVNIAGHYVLHGLFVGPASLYAVWRLLLWATHNAAHSKSSPPAYLGLLPFVAIVYTSLYGILYFFRAETGVAAVGSFASALAHTLFWHFAYYAPAYRGRRQLFFRDILVGLFLGSVVGVVGALSYVGWNTTPGLIHNLAGRAPFVRSDLDVPFLALVLAVWGVVLLMLRRQHRACGGPDGRPPSRLLGFALLSWSILLLILYARRTPLIALIGTTAFLMLPGQVGRKSVYLAVLFPFIPFVWNAAVSVLIPITQNPIADAVLARNSVEDYLTASNRVFMWEIATDILFKPDVRHFFGYGGAPLHLLRPEWTHLHNAFIQVVFDAGLIVLALAISLMIMAFRRVSATIRLGHHPDLAYMLLGVMVAWLIMAAVEPGLRGISIVHFSFLLFVLCIGNLYTESRLTHPVTAQGSETPYGVDLSNSPLLKVGRPVPQI